MRAVEGRGGQARRLREALREGVGRSPSILSDEAIRDFDAILARSLDRFGPTQAIIMRDRLMM